jgi:ubiquitin-protein ligase
MQPGTLIEFEQTNPKRKGSKAYERYEAYKVAKKVEEAMKLGAAKGDLVNDHKAAYLKIIGETSEAAPGVPSSPGKLKRSASAVEVAASAAFGVVPSPAKRRASEQAAVPNEVAAVASSAPVARNVVAPPVVAPEPAVAASAVAAPIATQPADPASAVLATSDPAPGIIAPVLVDAAPAAAQVVAPDLAAPAPAPAARTDPAPAAERAPAPVDAVPASPAVIEPIIASDLVAPVVSSSVAPVAESTSANAAAPKKQEEKVDLSFATGIEKKPHKYARRVIREAERMLCQKGLNDARVEGYEFSLTDRDSLSRWAVKVRDLNSDSQLVQDLQKLDLELSIDLEIILPDGFPLEPPFARVVYPELGGGYVFGHGGICFEPLTQKGWAPSMTLPSLVIAIKGILDHGGVRCKGAGDRAARTVKHFTEEGAKRDHKTIVTAHRGGEGASYGSLKYYKS